jgi:hypothetical protein
MLRARLGLWLIGLALALGPIGCRTFDVRTDFDPGIAFDGFKSYFWLEPPRVEGADPFADNALLRKRLRLAIEGELDARGYRRVDSRESADFLVSYGVVLEEGFKVNGVSSVGGAYGGRYFGYGYGAGFGTANMRPTQESTLIIDLLDPHTEDLVWRGWADGIVRTRDKDRGEERLRKGVHSILEAFPPGSSKPD